MKVWPDMEFSEYMLRADIITLLLWKPNTIYIQIFYHDCKVNRQPSFTPDHLICSILNDHDTQVCMLSSPTQPHIYKSTKLVLFSTVKY